MPDYTDHAPDGTVSILAIVLLVFALAGLALTFLAFQATSIS